MPRPPTFVPDSVNAFDVGLVVRSISNVVLTGPDGSRSTRNATPVVLQQVLLQLSVVTDQVSALIEQQLQSLYESCVALRMGNPLGVVTCKPDLGDQIPVLRRELEDWKLRLDGYRQHVNRCVASGLLLDWECAYWCATSPLLFGWYPNAQCTGVRIDQRVQKPPDLATPFTLMNQALVYGAHLDTESFLAFTTTMVEVAASAGGHAMTTAVQAAVDAAIDGFQRAIHQRGAGDTKPRRHWAVYAIGGAAIAGLAAYLYVK